ncbi:MAG: MBL fold metallo-hydrolase [Bacteroidetes bacterium]|nr:MBL fold metallo-hydrolase [Bacteroidota bacterium]
MLHIKAFTFNPFQENTYLIINDKKRCWIVDPGMYDQREKIHFNTYLSANGLQPVAIINTHTHLDHIFGVQVLKDQYKIPFGIHAKDQPVLRGAPTSAMIFGVELATAPEPDFFINETEKLKLDDEELDVRFTPGHSPGSIVFYYPQGGWVIGGDVLFNGSIGRTDLPGGNFETLLSSIRTELFSLPPETIVYSGHGPETSVGHEMRSNPFLQ